MVVKPHTLKPPRGARKRPKRVGRGDAAGQGSYAGRGIKGQKARSGRGPRPGFEGGQLPLVLRLPTKRGFRSPFPKDYAIVKLEHLEERFQPGEEVTPQRLLQVGLVKNLKRPIKVLANGELTKPLHVVAHRFSRQARERILAAGGTVRALEEDEAAQPQEGGPHGSG